MTKNKAMASLAEVSLRVAELPRMKGRSALALRVGRTLRFVKQHKMDPATNILLVNECQSVLNDMEQAAAKIASGTRS